MLHQIGVFAQRFGLGPAGRKTKHYYVPDSVGSAGGLLLAMILHGMVWSLLQIAFIPIVQVGDSVLRGPTARASIQVALFVFNLSPAIHVPLLLHGDAQIRQALRLYLVSLVVLAAIGWLQIASWYGLGFNPIPVGALSIALGGTDVYIREGQFLFDSLNIYRMNSFAGEPRNLGTALVLGMLFVQAIALATRTIPAGRLALLWAFFLASTAATFSTSAALTWVIGTAALLPVMWVFGIRIQRSTTSILAGLLILVVPIGIGIVTAEAAGIPVLNLIAERTLDRIDSNGAVEDYDLAITDYLRDNPVAALTGTGLGNAHLYATPYLDPVFAAYAEGQVFTGKTSVVRIVSELGFIGLALFLAWYLWLVIRVRALTIADPQMIAAVPIAMMSLAVFLATNQVAGEAWTMAGALAALIAARQPALRPLPSAARVPAA